MRRIVLVAVVVCCAAAPSVAVQPCGADCYQAETCERAEVQAAVDAALAASGGTVRIPDPASGACVWTAPVEIDARRPIRVEGQGEATTRIRVASSSAFEVNGVAGVAWSISHLSIEDGPCSGACDAIIAIGGRGDRFRVHHLSFTTSGEFVRLIRTHAHTYGLVDHITVRGTTPSEFITVDWDNWPEWKRPVELGSAEAVYVEDCDIAFSGSWEGRPFDGENGGRMVVRHNRLQNQMLGSHGFDTGYGSSIFSMVAYQNEFVFDDGASAWTSKTWGRFAHLRGGTGIVYDNTFRVGEDIWIGSPAIDLAIYRTPTDAGGNEHWLPCDGTAYRMCSNIDRDWNVLSHDHPMNCATDQDCVSRLGAGVTCKWKVCSRSGLELCQQDGDCPAGETCSAYLDGVGGDGYPCFMQPGFATHMRPYPWYEWGNTWSGGEGGSGCGRPSCDVDFGEDVSQLQENRDYYNDVPQGASLPASCAPYAGFWHTGEGRLYRCESENTWAPYYTPFPYPHPLQAGEVPDDGGPVDGDGGDAGVDAGVDAGQDAGQDAGEDAGVDASADAGQDAGVDPGTDAGDPGGTPDGGDGGKIVGGSGCGCASAGGGTAGFLTLLSLVAVYRRSRRK